MNEENETRADYRRRVNNQPESGTNGAGTGGNGRNPRHTTGAVRSGLSG